MNVLQLLIVGGVLAVAVYLFNRYLPGDPGIKRIVVYAVVAVFLIWVFRSLGGCGYLEGVRI